MNYLLCEQEISSRSDGAIYKDRSHLPPTRRIRDINDVTSLYEGFRLWFQSIRDLFRSKLDKSITRNRAFYSSKVRILRGFERYCRNPGAKLVNSLRQIFSTGCYCEV